VLVVGVGNSGAEIAIDVADSHQTWLAGTESGQVPFRHDGALARHIFLPLMFRVIGHRILTVRTPVGRKMRPKLLSHAAPLVRVKPADLAAAGIQRVDRVVGTRDGLPVLEDERVLPIENVIWCTGFRPDFSWIDLPVFDGQDKEPKEPIHVRGIVADEPGLYFVGLAFSTQCRQDFFPASAEMRNTSSSTLPRDSNQPPTPPGNAPCGNRRTTTESPLGMVPASRSSGEPTTLSADIQPCALATGIGPGT
jgi:hypothetical protein